MLIIGITTVAIGIFQAFIGFRMVDIVVSDPHTLVALGDVTSSTVLLSVGTIILIGVLIVHRVPGAMLLGIGASSVFSWVAGLQPLPTHVVELPTMRSMWSELRWEETLSRWGLCPCCSPSSSSASSTAGVQFGAGTGRSDRRQDRRAAWDEGRLPRLGVALSSVACSASPTIIHNETCAGIAEGGRWSGRPRGRLHVCAFGLLRPIFAAVPLTATAPTHHRWGIHDGPRWCHGLGQLQELAGVPHRCGHAAHLFHRQRRHCRPLSYAVLGVFTTDVVWVALQGCAGDSPAASATRRQKPGLREPLCLLAGRLLQRSQRPHACAQLDSLSAGSAAASPHSMVRNPHAAEQFWRYNGLNSLGMRRSRSQRRRRLPCTGRRLSPVGTFQIICVTVRCLAWFVRTLNIARARVADSRDRTR